MAGFVKKLHLVLAIYLGFGIYTMYETLSTEENNLDNQIPSQKEKIKKMEKERVQIRSYFKDIEEAKKRISVASDQIEKIKTKFPETISDTENMEILRNIANNLNIKDVFLSPGKEIEKGFYFEKNYNLKGQGTFLQFMILLEKIEEEERIFNIGSVAFNETKDKQKGRFQLVNSDIKVTTYRRNTKFNEQKELEKTNSEIEIRPVVKKPKKGRNKKK